MSGPRGQRRAWVQAGGRFHFDGLVNELRAMQRVAAAVTARRHVVQIEGVRTMRLLAWVRAVHFYSPLERACSSSLVWDRLFDELAARSFRRYLESHQGERMVFHGFAAYSLEGARVAREHGVPIIIDTGSSHITLQRDLVRKAYRDAGQKPRRFPEVWVTRQLAEYQLADRILVGSPFAARSFSGTGLEDKVRIARYGVDLERFRPKTSYSQHPPLVLGVVGNVNPEKGFDFLVAAVRRLGPEVELRVVGRVPRALRRWWYELRPAVSEHYEHLVGADLVRFLHEVDVFVLPSCQDGFSLAVLEAMACGTPCIVSANNGVAEVVEATGGLVVPAFDSRALADAIGWFGAHRSRIAESGRAAARVAVGELPWSAYAKAVEQVYKELDD